MTFNIKDFGAVADNKTINTIAIQTAINECFTKGGGVINIPAPGIFLSGSIQMRSHVTLNIENGAILKMSPNIEDFINHSDVVGDGVENDGPSYLTCEYTGEPRKVFIYSKDVENVQLTGGGTIDGNEEIFYGEETRYHIEGSHYPRVPMFFIENGTCIDINHIKFQNSGFWTIHLAGCRDVDISNLRIINNLRMANSDGINPDHCQNVRIQNCFIQAGDDCIVLKATEAYEKYGPTQDILVSNCFLISTSAAIKIGTETVSDFKNIHFTHCIIKNSNRGITLQLRDKGNIENVTFDHISINTRCFSEQWWGNGEAIYVTSFDRDSKTSVGKVRKVKFTNITGDCENGIVIAGEREDLIEDIYFENIDLTISPQGKWAPKGYDYRPSTLSPYKISGQPAALIVKNSKNVIMKNSDVAVVTENNRVSKEWLIENSTLEY